jgi:hypothetical protein
MRWAENASSLRRRQRPFSQGLIRSSALPFPNQVHGAYLTFIS